MSALLEQTTHSSEMTALLTALIALRQGRVDVRLPLDWTGVAGKVADAFNDVVEQNERMAEELARLSRVVGKEGKLSQRLSVGDVGGFWRESVGSVNNLIDDLVHPTIETARVIGAVAQGDLSKKMALDIDDRPLQGEFLRTAKTINTMVDQLGSFASEVTRVAREVGTEGKLGGQAKVKGVAGTWKDLTDSVNSMAGNLTAQVRNVAEVTTAVANGDLSKKITVDVKGEFLELKNTINTMVDQLRSFASEVTRVAREVGTEGKLGGQARVRRCIRHVEGSDRLRQRHGRQPDRPGAQHRRSDHGRRQRRPLAKITVDVSGEILELKNTINTMVDQLSSLRGGSDPRGPRSRHRRETRRSGRRARRGRDVEGPDRQRELHGRQPDVAGAQHRRRDQGRRRRRPVPQDHRRREGRNPRAQEHHQHDGRPVVQLRGGSDPRGPRSRHRRKARRTGRRARVSPARGRTSPTA